jgi:hypothetical protein
VLALPKLIHILDIGCNKWRNREQAPPYLVASSAVRGSHQSPIPSQDLPLVHLLGSSLQCTFLYGQSNGEGLWSSTISVVCLAEVVCNSLYTCIAGVYILI